MKRSATIVYWYDRDSMPHDGGGLRILAWEHALISLGYDVHVSGLNVGGPTLNGRTSRLAKVKRALAPMPLSRRLPDLARSDLYVVTVPVVFASAARALPRSAVIFDWMDLWSVNARTMGASSALSKPGGLVQSAVWKRREHYLPSRARFNTVAGYGDSRFVQSVSPRGQAAWLPTPTQIFTSDNNARRPIRRIGFLGNLAYEPNEMSLRQFFREYGHLLAERGLEVVVAGFGSDRVKTWGVPATVLGELKSVDDFYMSIDAVIVPVDHGGGIKVKAVEALSRGLTVFGTDHVREGFSPDFGSHIRGLGELFAVNPYEREAVNTASAPPHFASRFSQDAFTESVGGFFEEW